MEKYNVVIIEDRDDEIKCGFHHSLKYFPNTVISNIKFCRKQNINNNDMLIFDVKKRNDFFDEIFKNRVTFLPKYSSLNKFFEDIFISLKSQMIEIEHFFHVDANWKNASEFIFYLKKSFIENFDISYFFDLIKKQEDDDFIKFSWKKDVYFREYLIKEIKNNYNYKENFNNNLLNFFKIWKNITNDHNTLELIGKLGEVLFIKYCIKNRINWNNAYQETINNFGDVFDFIFFKKKFIDIKTTTFYKKEFHANFRQLPCFNQTKEIYFIAIVINKTSKGKTLCQLIEEIGINTNAHLKKIYNEWKNNKLIKEFTILENEYEIKLVNPDIIPKLTFNAKNNFKEGKIVISLASENSLLPIEKLKI